MSKQGALGEYVNRSTMQLPLKQFVAYASDVPLSGASAGVVAKADLNACAFFQLLLVIGRLMYRAKGNLYVVTAALVEEVVKEHGGALLDMLCNMREVANALRTAFENKGSPFVLRFLAECREDGEKKTPKMPRDLELPDLRQATTELLSLLSRDRCNAKAIGNAVRKCTRAPGGEMWLSVGAVILQTAVELAFPNHRGEYFVFLYVLF